ncbi:MAG: DHA2 family efflux MFS transporter permease subunit [Beijerinckiaceae bacterium]|nr:DHA2 family efflux MFS transporter permease subunit [Beijerinckiaceae bacterium]
MSIADASGSIGRPQTGRAPLKPAAPPAAQPLSARRVIAFVAMVFGMFMAILDIQIVSASLAEIQAGLSASADEIAWVQTSYLIAEVIMIPLSGLLARVFSTRYLFVFSAAGFTLMSILCATATSIEQMIVWRALQGFIGGGMIPTVFATAFSIFPKDKQPIVSPVIGLVATLAPTIGPTIGGYLTELFSWHWLFLVNVLPGIVVTLVTWQLIDFDKPDRSLLKQFDWWGLISMAGFLGALEYVLEEGPSKDWLESQPVAICLAISVVSCVVFFWRAFTAPQPIVDLTTFRDRNFWTGSLFSFVLGVGLYGLTYLYPVYLARVRGYSALQIGETMFLTGICMFITAPIAGRLVRIVDPRWMMVAGFSGFAIGTFLASDITKDWDFGNLVLPQIFRGVSLMLCMIPITNTALGTLPPERLKNASGLFNLMRNLGGAFGLALINTMINKRLDLHLARLHETVSWGRNAAEETLASMTLAMASRGSDAEMAAISKLSAIVRREATVMAIGDVFLALTVLFLLVPFLIPLMRRPRPPSPEAAGGH